MPGFFDLAGFVGGTVASFLFQPAGTPFMTRALTGVVVMLGMGVGAYLKPYLPTISFLGGASSTVMESLIVGVGVAITMVIATYIGFGYSFSELPTTMGGFAWNVLGGAAAAFLGTMIMGFGFMPK